ncbi:peptide chain release factor N(5)-glutamine methyltransferase [Acetivibrio mesophilus]|uniref:Release factor glutamine methyltransferase n=1 Tax=Acetivibrio mesophilus TaxID=2487273 RepID=A0A4Q0I3C6_9FIRM|nr:peptide chain release factor N(5)-glutamine methyltransferase [Acetivibrio mesophilus]ODM27212.1 protein-(glutamine-N5) methyltransferase, release factor-specific [Clostridium sp. Bc-iso-3]RXE58753.1 peptide chain release factor N(5)-glutamine methyltransferase [Acetivibrio mesophilus]
MILKDALLKGIKLLKSADIDTPALEAGVLLCHVLNVDRSFLYSHDDYSMKDEEYEKFAAFLDERVRGKPLQYITGHQEFMSLDFIVTPDVLIPRQDTETLVEVVLGHVKDTGLKNARILDIGTGSGCIAVSLAHFVKDCRVLAVDISEGALATAEANARRCGVEDRVSFLKGDVFGGLFNAIAQSPFAKVTEHNEEGIFDIIVSNPPYIPAEEIKTLHRQVKDFEPGTALNGGEDGLDFYRVITCEATKLLSPGSLLAFEVGYGQAKDVWGLMERSYCAIKSVKDLAGIDRVVMGYRK